MIPALEQRAGFLFVKSCLSPEYRAVQQPPNLNFERKRTMKKLMSILLISVLALSLLAGCAKEAEAPQNTQSAQPGQESQSAADEKVRIGIVQPMEHTSLTQIRESIIAEFDALGISDKIEIIYKDAQGDAGNVTTIVNQFVGDGVDYIIPIATGPAQTAAAATKTIPIVFAAISYPVDAGLVTANDKTDGNVTGVSDPIPVEDIFELAKELTPGVQTFGFIYNAGEPNSISNIERARAYCDANGIQYVEATIAGTSDLLQAAQSLVGKVDAIFVPNDNTTASAMGTLANEANKAGIPVYTGADSMVIDGGFATVGIDYTILGKQVARMVKRLMDGQTIAENPVEVVDEYAKIVNKTTAATLGIALSDEVLSTFTVVE